MTPSAAVGRLALVAFAALAGGCSKRALDDRGSAGLGGVSGGGTGGGASGGSEVGGGSGSGGGGSGGRFTATRKLDMLFVIEDAPSMLNAQGNLTLNFPTLMKELMALPGQPPDLHIAVVSTDMGVASGTHLGCNTTGGENGVFQHVARGTCTATGLEAGATYIADGPDGRNYAGSLEDVFACIARLGEDGCRFGQPLAAAARALGADGHAAPAENAGFLRDDAFLFVVFLARSDDCSAPAGSPLFDTANNTTVADPLGPPTHFRCNEFGHLCGHPAIPPPRNSPTGDSLSGASLTDCVPAEEAGKLTPVHTFAAQLRSLKQHPDLQIVVSAIAGKPAPYNIWWATPPSLGTGPWPIMAPSCQALPAGITGDPGVRLSGLINAFGANGSFVSVCEASYAPIVVRIAELLGSAGQRD